MSQRLTYSLEGFVRKMQISTRSMFIFVEGHLDRYFYDRLCRAAFSHSLDSFEVIGSEELRVKQPGKQGLCEWYEFLESRAVLVSKFKGHGFASVVVLDKDIDDLTGEAISSRNVIYTDHYSIENHLVEEADLVEGMAASAVVDATRLRHCLPADQGEWRRRAAGAWREWVTLCVFSRLYGLNCPANYGRSSQVHDGPYGGVDSVRLEEFRRLLRTAMGDPADFDAKMAQTHAMVEALYEKDAFDSVFRGKWYRDFAAEEVRRCIAGGTYDSDGVGKRFFETLAAVNPMSGAWAMSVMSRLKVLGAEAAT